ncbi:hypothetical protein AOQ84DRAFT_70037 [Glonium stellatum]|uniref:Uncharacterized protein n=1 Tax=Glonium stellatum TaxID=574774 RepID=A0A8E2EY58_9PEZI|nr:hypothetical protein AOQ84DRAFT_70037 [Glonium stellatum]
MHVVPGCSLSLRIRHPPIHAVGHAIVVNECPFDVFLWSSALVLDLSKPSIMAAPIQNKYITIRKQEASPLKSHAIWAASMTIARN